MSRRHFFQSWQDDVWDFIHDKLKVFFNFWVSILERWFELTHSSVNLKNLISCVANGLLPVDWIFLLCAFFDTSLVLLLILFVDRIVISNVHSHSSFDYFWRCLHSHISILDFWVVFVSHLSEIRVDVIETLLIFFKNEIVIVLIHLWNLPFLL